uniref:Uncharacterized protein n=1 Tax=Anguilla anguilla TaxID=7936 RepID=A0A0E9VB42_ANGAN
MIRDMFTRKPKYLSISDTHTSACVF